MGKSPKYCVSSIFCDSNGRKMDQLKPFLRRQLGRWEMNNCMPLQREGNESQKRQNATGLNDSWELTYGREYFQLNIHKTHHGGTTCGKYTFLAKNIIENDIIQNTPGLDDFWKVGYRKSGRPFGPKHIESQNPLRFKRSFQFSIWQKSSSLFLTIQSWFDVETHCFKILLMYEVFYFWQLEGHGKNWPGLISLFLGLYSLCGWVNGSGLLVHQSVN